MGRERPILGLLGSLFPLEGVSLFSSHTAVEGGETSAERRERLGREYDELQALFAKDKLPAKADAVFLPALADDVIDAYKLFDRIDELVKANRVNYIIYNDIDVRGVVDDSGKVPWKAGAEWYREEFKKRNIPEEMLIASGQNGRNTRLQTDELIDTCKAHGFSSVIMASVTYHNTRLMSAAIGSMAEKGYSIAAYCLNAPLTVPTSTLITMSQGVGKQTLEAEIAADRERGIDYLDKGSPPGNELKWTTPLG